MLLNLVKYHKHPANIYADRQNTFLGLKMGLHYFLSSGPAGMVFDILMYFPVNDLDD